MFIHSVTYGTRLVYRTLKLFSDVYVDKMGISSLVLTGDLYLKFSWPSVNVYDNAVKH